MSLTFEDVRSTAIELKLTNDYVIKLSTEFFKDVNYPDSVHDTVRNIEFDIFPLQGTVIMQREKLLEINPYTGTDSDVLYFYSKRQVPSTGNYNALTIITLLGKPSFFEVLPVHSVPKSIRNEYTMQLQSSEVSSELAQYCMDLINEIRSGSDMTDRLFNLMLSGVTLQDLNELCDLPYVNGDVYYLKYSHVRAAIKRTQSYE